MFAYEQSFLCLAYHCDLWYEATAYLCKNSNRFLTYTLPAAAKEAEQQQEQQQQQPTSDELDEMNESAASCLFERAATTFMKNNILIHLAFADFEEVFPSKLETQHVRQLFTINNLFLAY